MESNLKIVEWNIDKLISAEYNPRKLSEEQKQKIKDSISRFGLVDPVIVNTNKERFGIIIGGHQRTKVSREMGFKKMPCVELDLNLDQEKELNVRLNKNTGEFDKELLVEYFDQDDLIDWGFDNEYFEDVVTEIDAPEEDDFNGELPTEPQTVLGDLYELNGHRVHCASSTEIDAVEKLMDGKKADMVFTDPPYGINVVKGEKVEGDKSFGSVGGNKIVKAKKYSKVIGDDTTETAKEFYQTCVSLEMENFIIWGGNYFTDFLKPSMCWVVWDKENTGNFADIEMAWTSFEKGAKLYKWQWNGMIRKGDKNTEGKTRFHPTQKPVGLFVDIFKDFDFKICFDGFVGSGSTLIASEQLDRLCYGQELDPKYCDVIVKRWVKYMTDNDRKFTVKRNGEDITKETWINE